MSDDHRLWEFEATGSIDEPPAWLIPVAVLIALVVAVPWVAGAWAIGRRAIRGLGL